MIPASGEVFSYLEMSLEEAKLVPDAAVTVQEIWSKKLWSATTASLKMFIYPRDFLNVCFQIDFKLRAGMEDFSEHVFIRSGRGMTIVQRIGSEKINVYSPKTALHHECYKIIEAVN
jgi:hypothetical protein